MSLIVYGLDRSRITLYDVDGTTPLYRITLQREAPEGLKLQFTHEGVTHHMGSGAGWANHLTHRGHRAQLSVKWNYGVRCDREAWTGSAWGAPSKVLTATAISIILTHAFQTPCKVEPRIDTAWNFLAQPDPAKAFELRDTKGVAHPGLELVLIAVTLASIPDWENL